MQILKMILKTTNKTKKIIRHRLKQHNNSNAYTELKAILILRNKNKRNYYVMP